MSKSSQPNKVQKSNSNIQNKSQRAGDSYNELIKLQSTAKYYKFERDEYPYQPYYYSNQHHYLNVDHQQLFQTFNIHSSYDPAYHQIQKIPKLNVSSSVKTLSNIQTGYPRPYEDQYLYFSRQPRNFETINYSQRNYY